MTLGIKVKNLREEKGWSQRQLALKADISNTAISKIENDKYNPSLETLRSIANALGIEVTDLINIRTIKEGTDITNIQKIDLNGNTDYTQHLGRLKPVQIPIVGMVKAGEPETAIENIEGYLTVDRSHLKPNKEYYSLKISGDSMSQELPDGTFAVIEKTTDIQDGDIAVIGINGYEATLKKIEFVKDGLIAYPLSNNTMYRPKFYNYEVDDVHLLGKLVMSIKTY